jgi:hypothetical protein
LRLFDRLYLHPSLRLDGGQGFRLGLGLRFAGQGNEPFYRGLAFMFLEGLT